MKEYLCLHRRHPDLQEVTLIFVPLEEDEAITALLALVEKYDALYLDETKIYNDHDIELLQNTSSPKGQFLN